MSANPSITVKDHAQIQAAAKWLTSMLTKGLNAGAVVISLGREIRSLDQNSKMWPMLTDVSRQRQMVINGVLEWAEPKDWKDVFTAALRKESRMAQGIDGGVVFLGMRTSRMKKAEFRDLIELIYAYGAEHKIRWSEPALRVYEETCRVAA